MANLVATILLALAAAALGGYSAYRYPTGPTILSPADARSSSSLPGQSQTYPGSTRGEKESSKSIVFPEYEVPREVVTVGVMMQTMVMLSGFSILALAAYILRASQARVRLHLLITARRRVRGSMKDGDFESRFRSMLASDKFPHRDRTKQFDTIFTAGESIANLTKECLDTFLKRNSRAYRKYFMRDTDLTISYWYVVLSGIVGLSCFSLLIVRFMLPIKMPWLSIAERSAISCGITLHFAIFFSMAIIAYRRAKIRSQISMSEFEDVFRDVHDDLTRHEREVAAAVDAARAPQASRMT